MPSNTSSNKAVVPEAKGALDRFKYEVANELGVPLTDGYNGNLTSKQIRRWIYGQKDDRSTGTPDVQRLPGRPAVLNLYAQVVSLLC